MMGLFTREGVPKLVPACTYPLTGIGCVSRIYTGHAVFVIEEGGVRVRETFGITFDELRRTLPDVVLTE